MNLVPSKLRQKAPVAFGPRGSITSLQREMNSLVNDFFNWGELSPLSRFSSNLYPTVDIKEEKDKYFVEADVPGMSEKDLSIDVRNNVLTISGKLDSESKKDEKNYVCIERAHESFSRDIYLADDVDLDNIKAELKSGVLHIELSKSETGNNYHKKIPIKRA